MDRKWKRAAPLLAVLLLALALWWTAGPAQGGDTGAPLMAQSTQAGRLAPDPGGPATPESPREDQAYDTAQAVVDYLDAFGHLPPNYLTKHEAQRLGWDSRAGNLGEVAPGKSIGGDKFGNYDGALPAAAGRTYRECDIAYDGGYRGGKRLVWSSDGLYFYTEDHYETFVELTASSASGGPPGRAAP